MSIALTFGIKSTLLLLAALVLWRLLAFRGSAATRHLVLQLALAATVLLLPASLLLPSWTLDLPAWTSTATPAPSLGQPAATTANAMARMIEPGPAEPWSDAASALPAVDPSAAPSAEPARWALVAEDASEAAIASSGLRTRNLLLVVWLAGSLLLLARIGLALTRLRAMERRAEPADPALLEVAAAAARQLLVRRLPRILVSAEIEVPVVYGWTRPGLIVPESAREWSAERLELVLVHELSHLARHDWLWLLFGRAASAMLWFQPLVWLTAAAARHEAEQAADDRVLSVGAKPSDYAAHLLAIVRSLGAPRPLAWPAAGLFLARRSEIGRRLEAILCPRRSRRAPGRLAATLAATVSLATLLPLAMLAPSAAAAPGGSILDPVGERHPEGTGSFGGEPGTIEEGSSDRGWSSTSSDDSNPNRSPNEPMVLAQRSRERVRLAERNHETKSSAEGERAYDDGYDHYHDEDWTTAAQLFARAAELGYRRGTSLYNAACSLALSGQAERAIETLGAALEAGFDSADHLLEDSDLDSLRRDPRFRALVEEHAGAEADRRIAHAQRDLEELRESGERDADQWYETGSELLRLRQLDPAIEALGRAVELEPHAYNARYNLACGYALAGQLRSALDALDAAIQDGYDSPEHMAKDADLASLRETVRFRELHQEAELLSLGRYQRDWWPKFGGGSVPGDARSRRQWGPAIDVYQEYVGANPSSGRGWFNLGWALHFSGRHQDAVPAFERAARLGYRTATSTYNVACAEARSGRVGPALDALERAIAAGFEGDGMLEHDDDLDALRGEARFEALVRKAKARSKHKYDKEW